MQISRDKDYDSHTIFLMLDLATDAAIYDMLAKDGSEEQA